MNKLLATYKSNEARELTNQYLSTDLFVYVIFIFRSCLIHGNIFNCRSNISKLHYGGNVSFYQRSHKRYSKYVRFCEFQ